VKSEAGKPYGTGTFRGILGPNNIPPAEVPQAFKRFIDSLKTKVENQVKTAKELAAAEEEKSREWRELCQAFLCKEYASSVKVMMGNKTSIEFRRHYSGSISATISSARSNIPLIRSLIQTVQTKKKLDPKFGLLEKEAPATSVEGT
jgi:hypothetical protein